MQVGRLFGKRVERKEENQIEAALSSRSPAWAVGAQSRRDHLSYIELSTRETAEGSTCPLAPSPMGAGLSSAAASFMYLDATHVLCTE